MILIYFSEFFIFAIVSCEFSFINCSLSSPKLAEKAIHKGSKLYIEGKLKSRTYINQSGVEKNITEIVYNLINAEVGSNNSTDMYNS